MITKNFFILITIIWISSGFACEINLPKYVLLLKKIEIENLRDNFKYCPNDVSNEVISILNSVEGKISKKQIDEILSSKNLSAKIHPELIQIQNLTTLVREKFQLPINVEFELIDTINLPPMLTLNNGDNIDFDCNNCSFVMEQNLKLKFQKLNGEQDQLTLRLNFKNKIKAYVLKTFVPPFSQINREQLREEFIEPIPHTELITNIETLKFFKTNKPIKPGEILKKSDLNGSLLVKAGSNTEVIIENQLLKLKTTGISRNSGIYGDQVEVLNIQKNKKYVGKIIDINKIQVEI
jgi:flagella basal body P-ring formation protein FlgA